MICIPIVVVKTAFFRFCFAANDNNITACTVAANQLGRKSLVYPRRFPVSITMKFQRRPGFHRDQSFLFD